MWLIHHANGIGKNLVKKAKNILLIRRKKNTDVTDLRWFENAKQIIFRAEDNGPTIHHPNIYDKKTNIEFLGGRDHGSYRKSKTK